MKRNHLSDATMGIVFLSLHSFSLHTCYIHLFVIRVPSDCLYVNAYFGSMCQFVIIAVVFASYGKPFPIRCDPCVSWNWHEARRNKEEKKSECKKKNLCGAIYESSGVSFFVNNEYEKIRNDFVLFVRWKFLFIETHMEYVRQQIPSLPMRSCFFFCA